ncbi:MAG: hypothetical protein K6B75_01970, partial [Lachnospiraceae bacterium]|nr:hypothetical protein [Lachnospiraceae bacterium]
MAVELKPGAVNQIKKGTVLFEEKGDVSFICAVIKGHISAYTEAAGFQVTVGGFIGVADIFEGKYLATYVADQDTV